ncbi:hypothetical protein ACPA2G_11035 [Staphylococcus aureus]|uniref:hypothetical protein n=1 Tax=Staphylococcus aureus TaxID=1280 RepID=UPI003C704FEA
MNKGDKYNRLTAVKEIDNRKWLFRCICGNEKVISKYDVQKGHTKSCGCLQKENTSKAKRTHGDTDSRLYYIWENMRKRCYKPNSDRYKNYGARGITICDDWKNNYSNFYKWAYSNGYNDNLTIERIDINGNYEPSNCTWITMKDQAKNRTSNKWVCIDNVKYSPQELEKIYKIPVKTIYARIARGDKGHAVVRPLGKRQFHKR